jgi:hypothetical protein
MLAGGCDETKSSSAPGGSASVAAKASAAVSAKPAPPPAPWFVGTWQGSYDAQHYLIEMTKGQGAVREWGDDDGGTGEGEGKITLQVTEDGAISGAASGPLGDMVASGQVDEDDFRVRLSPKAPGERAFNGVFVAKRKGDSLSGRLQASTGDSRTVRDAPVELKKGGTAAAPAGSAP